MKKLLASMLTLAVAVVLGLGTIGCTKKDEVKKETKTVTTPDKTTTTEKTTEKTPDKTTTEKTTTEKTTEKKEK